MIILKGGNEKMILLMRVNDSLEIEVGLRLIFYWRKKTRKRNYWYEYMKLLLEEESDPLRALTTVGGRLETCTCEHQSKIMKKKLLAIIWWSGAFSMEKPILTSWWKNVYRKLENVNHTGDWRIPRTRTCVRQKIRFKRSIYFSLHSRIEQYLENMLLYYK